MKSIRVLFVLIPLLLSACMSADVRKYGQIDNSQKSITVPPGGGLAAELKDILRGQGWTMVVDQGPDVIEGQASESVKLKSYNTFNSRYRLLLRAVQFDVCLSFDPALRYNLSLIDNKTGQEVMVMGGSACQNQIKAKFAEFLATGG